MAGIYGLHYFMFCCVVVASGGAGQSDGGICGVVSRLEALQAQIASELELLTKDITELGECDKITCPEGYVMPCGDVCYRLHIYNGTSCSSDGGRFPVPMSQQHITCLLALASDTSLPVYTTYRNRNGTHFTSGYDSSVVAPAELVGEPGPNGDTLNEKYVVIDRKSGKLVRSENLSNDDGWAWACEKPPLQ